MEAWEPKSNERVRDSKTSVRESSFLTRIARIVGSIAVVFASLIMFPEFFPATLGLWLAFYFVQIYRGRIGWIPLISCLGLIAIKFPEPSIGMIAFFLIVAVACFANFRKSNKLTYFNIAVVGAWAVLMASHWWGGSIGKTVSLDCQRPIVCLGDSLTDFGYPDDLRKLVSVPIEDFGFNGYTTDEGLELVPDILAKNPQAIILELGGHDYKNGVSRSATRANLNKLIESFRAIDAQVVIVEIPRGFINDPFFGIERELAREHDLQLIPDTMVRGHVFWSPIAPPGTWLDKSTHLSKDGLHPNAAGNERMACYAADALEKVFGPKIRLNR